MTLLKILHFFWAFNFQTENLKTGTGGGCHLLVSFPETNWLRNIVSFHSGDCGPRVSRNQICPQDHDNRAQGPSPPRPSPLPGIGLKPFLIKLLRACKGFKVGQAQPWSFLSDVRKKRHLCPQGTELLTDTAVGGNAKGPQCIRRGFQAPNLEQV